MNKYMNDLGAGRGGLGARPDFSHPGSSFCLLLSAERPQPGAACPPSPEAAAGTLDPEAYWREHWAASPQGPAGLCHVPALVTGHLAFLQFTWLP